MKLYRLALAVIFCVFLYAPAYTQLLDPVSYQITNIPSQVKAGELFTVTVRAEIAGEWHLYSALNDPAAGPYPTTFTPAADQLMTAGYISETAPRIVFDPNFNKELGWHDGKAEFYIPAVWDTAARGDRTVAFDILYQVCDDRSCLPPRTKQVSSTLTISGISDTPFISSENMNGHITQSLYRFPSAYIPGMVDYEWIFWLILTASLGGLFLASRTGFQKNI